MLKKTFEPLRPYAPTILRVMAGVTFLVHGIGKLLNPAGFVGFVGSLGFPLPVVFAWLVILLEAVGGLLMILGLVVRPVSLGLVLEMLVTTVVVKSNIGFIAPQGGGAGFELDLMLLAASAAVLILGAGALSIDESVLERGRVTQKQMA